MPSSTAPVSESGPPVGAAVVGQIVHGQAGGGWVADAVVNVQVAGVIMLPAVSRAAGHGRGVAWSRPRARPTA